MARSLTSPRAISGPASWLSATARLSLTTGLSAIWIRDSYRTTIWCQSVSSHDGAFRMQRGDSALDLEGAGRPHRTGFLQQPEAFGDRGTVPQGPVLVRKKDHLTGLVESGSRTCQVELHQREQSDHLGLVGHQGRDQ